MSGEDLFGVDRLDVRASFDRASVGYEASAVLQARVAEELLSRLEMFRFRPGVVLDLGSGTGRTTAALKQRYGRALVIAADLAPGMLEQARRYRGWFRRFQRVCADAHRLPFADASVDVIFSSLMLQWCRLDEALAEIRRVLRPEGFLAFSTFGPDTLMELRAAWAQADEHSHVNRFIDMHDIGSALVRAGLTEPVLDVDRIQLTYSDVTSLMRDLKAVGAHNLTTGRSRALTGKQRLKKMEAAYEAFRRDQRLPATYEVVYAAAWGAAGRPAAAVSGGEITIPPGSIRRRKPS